ncbi:hypothetical protein [Halosimplex sp. J119]
MTGATLDDLARASERRSRVPSLLLGAVGVVVALSIDLLAAAGICAGLYVVSLVPLCGARDETRLATDRSPEAVRSEFTGPECPLFAIERQWVDAASDHESGFEFVAEGLSGTWKTVFDVREPVEGSADFVLEMSQYDRVQSTHAVRIEAGDDRERTVVVVTSETRKVTAEKWLRAFLQGPISDRALERQGYDVLESNSSLFI